MNKRPVIYTAACSLSFLGGTIAAFFYFASTIFYQSFAEKIISLTNDLSMTGTSPSYFLLLAIAHSLSVTSIILLWKFRKNGFYIYIVSQLAIILLPIIFISKNSFSTTNFIFTILFTGIYSFYYLWISRNIS